MGLPPQTLPSFFTKKEAKNGYGKRCDTSFLMREDGVFLRALRETTPCGQSQCQALRVSVKKKLISIEEMQALSYRFF
jgi:hypothetical protein